MTPAVLKKGIPDLEAVAIGKWHTGALLKNHTPTYRGFDSFFGYYHAAVSSYWYHGGEGGGCEGTDLSNSTGANGKISPANRADLNGTYDTTAFTDEAVRKILAHNASRPLYMYLAYQAVHAASANDKLVLNAPLDTVQGYKHVVRRHKTLSSVPNLTLKSVAVQDAVVRS
jgi:hypothetical protein